MDFYNVFTLQSKHKVEGRTFNVILNYYLSTLTIEENGKVIYKENFEAYDNFDGSMDQFVAHIVKGNKE